MAEGLQVWDEQGRLILDATDRLGRVVGSVLTGGASGSLVSSGMDYGQPWYALILEPGQSEGYTSSNGVVTVRKRPTITISGRNISWTTGVPCRLIYGVY